MKIIPTLAIAALMITTAPAQSLREGTWRATLHLKDSAELPFSMEASLNAGKYTLTIVNGKERIRVDDVSMKQDSLHARLPVFDSEIIAKVSGNSLSGYWINYSKKANNRIAFHATHGISYRFTGKKEKPAAIAGRWETDFSPGTADSSKAIGVFSQEGNTLYGTFLTPTGDYRYLEGEMQGNELMLSCFDGSHAFLFRASQDKTGKLHGTFWSGSQWSEPWIAAKNEAFELPDPNTLTYLKPGYDKVSFKFPSLNGDSVSLSDEKFRNRVVVVQIMGSWCPNCMDESAFLSGYYKANKAKGLEIIGLAYEKVADPAHARANVNRLKDRFDIGYTLLLAGPSNKTEAAKTLPMLNQILSFPTTIFIDKKGRVRRIHTGFAGPATGASYEKFKEEFSAFIDKLEQE